MRAWIWTCLVVLAGCEPTDEVKLEMSCTTICTCVEMGPLVQPCINECIADGDLALISEDCFECIQVHSMQCSTLETDCEPLCDTPRPPPEGPDGGTL